MNNKRPTVYEEFKAKGYSRREFITFCSLMGAWLGLEASGVSQVVKATHHLASLPGMHLLQ